MKKYLIALPCFRGAKGFCHRTILVSAKSKSDAIALARHLRPHDNIGDIKAVDYQGDRHGPVWAADTLQGVVS